MEHCERHGSPALAGWPPRHTGALRLIGRPGGPARAGAAWIVLLGAWLLPVGSVAGAQVNEPSSQREEARRALAYDRTGPVYTWRDGERALPVWRQRDLTIRATGDLRPRDQVVSRIADDLAVVRREARAESGDLPVFRSPAGELMTLPGGVMLIFDSSWGENERTAFLESKGIEPERVSRSENLPFLFIVETEPGFPSLDLANALADEPGVEVSSPNWWIERFTR